MIVIATNSNNTVKPINIINKTKYRIFNHYKGLKNPDHVEIGNSFSSIEEAGKAIENLSALISKENLKIVCELITTKSWDISCLTRNEVDFLLESTILKSSL